MLNLHPTNTINHFFKTTMKKILLSALACIAVSLTGLASEVYETLPFGGKTGDNFNWPSTNQYTETHTSNISVLGTTWTQSHFSNNNNGWANHRCGWKTGATIATLCNDNALSVSVTKLVATASFPKSGKLTSAKLDVADNKDFNNATTFTLPSVTTAGEWTFTVPEEAIGPNKFYKLSFDCPKSSNNGFLGISEIKIYYLDDPDTPTLDDAGLSFPEASYTVNVGETFTAPELTKTTDAAATYESSNTGVATVDASSGAITIVGVGTTTITATTPETDVYKAGNASYTLKVVDPTLVVNTSQFIFNGEGTNVVGMSSKTNLEAGTSTKNDASNDLTGVTLTADNKTTISFAITGSESHPRFWNDGARLYAGNTMKVAAPEGYEITSITFAKGSKWGLQIGTTSITAGKWEPTSPVESQVFEFSARTDIISITVEIAQKIVEDKKLGDIVVKKDGTAVGETVEVTKGETLTIECANAEKVEVTNAAAETVATLTTLPAEWMPTETGVYTFTATLGEQTPKTTNVNITVNEPVNNLGALMINGREIVSGQTYQYFEDDDITFSCENAVSIVAAAYINEYSESADAFMMSANSSSVKWGITPAKEGRYFIHLMAQGDNIYVDKDIDFYVEFKTVVKLGTIMLNDVEVQEGENYTFTEGTELKFSAANAERMTIEVKNGEETVVDETLTADSYTWSGMNPGTYSVMVKAELGSTDVTESATKTFTVTINEYIPMTEETYNYTATGYDNGNVTLEYTDTALEGITLKADKADGSTAPAYNTSNNDMRVYANSTLTISVPADITVTKLVFNLSAQGKKRLPKITADSGTIATQAKGDETVTWTGSVSGGDIILTVGAKATYGDKATDAGQFCFSTGTITTERKATKVMGIAHEIVQDDGKVSFTYTLAVNNHHKNEKYEVSINVEGKGTYSSVEHTVEVPQMMAYSENSVSSTHALRGSMNIPGIVKGETYTYTVSVKHNDRELTLPEVAEPFSFVATTTTTSISEVGAEERAAEVEWYDMAGRRVASPAGKGVFIKKQGSRVSKLTF